MKAISAGESQQLPARLATLLGELDAEIVRVKDILETIRFCRLPSGQREALLGELSASVLHLHVHTEGLDEIILDEISGKGSGYPHGRSQRGDDQVRSNGDSL